jgi:hypothetical protein
MVNQLHHQSEVVVDVVEEGVGDADLEDVEMVAVRRM